MAFGDEILKVFLLVQDEVLAFFRDAGCGIDDLLAVFVGVIAGRQASAENQNGMFCKNAHDAFTCCCLRDGRDAYGCARPLRDSRHFMRSRRHVPGETGHAVGGLTRRRALSFGGFGRCTAWMRHRFSILQHKGKRWRVLREILPEEAAQTCVFKAVSLSQSFGRPGNLDEVGFVKHPVDAFAALAAELFSPFSGVQHEPRRFYR